MAIFASGSLPVFVILSSDVIVHIQAAMLVIIAVVGTFVQVLHRRSRQLLRLQYIPGTIAAAISIGDEANLIQLLKDQQEWDHFEALEDKLFHIDPRTMKIVVVEDGRSSQLGKFHIFMSISAGRISTWHRI